MIHLDYRDTRPIYVQIADGFREQIASGILESGEKLPSVRELAMQLSINPNTIQRSYRQLEAEGWIATVPGKGCFVCGIPQGARGAWEELFSRFDEIVLQLESAGVPREELIRRLSGGGKNYD